MKMFARLSLALALAFPSALHAQGITINNLGQASLPISPTDLAVVGQTPQGVLYKAHVSDLIAAVGAPFVPLAGGTMTGPLILSGDPTAALGAATKQYVDTAPFLPLAGGTMTGPLAIGANLISGSNFLITGGVISNPVIANSINSGTNTSIGSTYPYNNGNAGNLYNTAIGIQALSSATSLPNNVAIGYQAAWKLVSGGNETAVGTSALLDDTTGIFNTALGSAAMRHYVGGSIGGNVAVGHGAMAGDDFTPVPMTGALNTGVGAWSLQELTTGINNTCVGASSCVLVATGTDNATLGEYANAGCPTYAGCYAHSNPGNASSYNVAIGSYALFLNTVDFNVGIGYKALTYNTTGQSNVAVGFSSGFSQTTATNNVYLGSTTGYANVTGTSNVGVGYYALRDNTSNQNTAVGTYALYQNTTGQYNTAIGSLSQAGVSTGVQNTSVGYNSLNAVTSGTLNTVVGGGAGSFITTGTWNTALGQGALGASTTDNLNTAIGALSLNVANGGSNTAVGSNSGLRVTTGTANAIFGAAAGSQITTGAHNTIIGDAAAATNLTTGSYNIIIGANADVTSAAASNLINIGGIIYQNNNSIGAPAVTACGTSAFSDGHANNKSGTITAGAGGPASCTVTFAGTGYSTWNHCRVTSETPIANFGYTYTTTVLTITGTSLSGGKFDYDCDGQ